MKKNPCKTICIQNGKYEAIKWPQNYSGDMLWLGSADEGTFLFTKYKDIMGIYSRDLTWFESKIIPALYPILIYSDIPLGKHL